MNRRIVAATALVLLVAVGLFSAATAVADEPSPTATANVTVKIPGVLGFETTAPTASGIGAGTAGSAETGQNASGDSGATQTAGAASTKSVSSGSVLLIRPWHIHPGDRYQVEGSGFAAGERVDFVLLPGARALGSATANPSGTAIDAFSFPRSGGTGMYRVVATGALSKWDASGQLSVVGPALPTTTWWALAIAAGAVLLAVGALLLATRLGALGASFLVEPSR